jgi:predicted AlkP superfamily phosphohydrolase/phosphomutase
MSLKVFVVGLDGATFDLLRPWAEQRYLPSLFGLMQGGAWGDLRSTVPPMTAPAWTSFATGKNPGKHGLYDWIRRDQGSYDVSPLTAQHIAEPTLWSLLSERSRRVCVFNVPMTYPPQPVNGLMISGMPAPSTRVTITYPSWLLEELQREVGEYLLYPDPGQAYSDAGIDSFLTHLYDTTKTRLRTLDYLRGQEEWDFLMVVFNGTDTVQHALWKYMSPEHPLYDAVRGERYGDTILRYYQFLDQALGRLVDSLDDATVLVIMSDHGFGPFHKFIHVNNWLRQHGWLHLRRNPWSWIKSALFQMGFAPMPIYNLLMELGLGGLKREVVRGRGQGVLKKLFLSFDDVDWRRTVAYSLGNVGQIYLNVQGREPLGTVPAGTAYETLRDEIASQLQKLRDPQTGEAVVQEIYRREDIYDGPALERAADILFIPTRMEYFGFGEYEFGSNRVVEAMKRGISGTHRMNGVMLMYGKPVRSGVQIKGSSICDLAPTILHVMGMPVPSDMDGRVLTEALVPPYADPSLVQYVDRGMGTTESSMASELDAGEEAIVVERLRNLGYVA